MKAEATALAEAAQKEGACGSHSRTKGQPPKTSQTDGRHLLNGLRMSVRILDTACGSGNFLYLALRRILDLWHEVRVFLAGAWIPDIYWRDRFILQLFGLETNVYAQELASVVVWIGYLQWLNEHAIGWPRSRSCGSSITSNIAMPSWRMMRREGQAGRA